MRRRLVFPRWRPKLISSARERFVAGSIAVRILSFVGALASVAAGVTVVFIVVASARPRIVRFTSSRIFPGHRCAILETNLVCPIAEPGPAVTAAVNCGNVVSIAVAVTPRAALIVVARPESRAISVTIGILIDPDRTHPIPVAAACLAGVWNTKVLGIVFAPFVPSLLHAIAIAVLISVLPCLDTVTMLIVIIVVIPLCTGHSAQGKRDASQQCCELQVSRHFIHLRSWLEQATLRLRRSTNVLILVMRAHNRFDASEIADFVGLKRSLRE